MKTTIYDEQFFILKSKGVKYKLSFHQDNDSEDPRHWDPPATMLCWHRNYSLGDKHTFTDISNALEHLLIDSGKALIEVDATMDLCVDETKYERDKRVIEELKDYACIKFLYLYDHGGIIMSLKDFKDPWDSGIVGIMYMTKQTTLDNFPNSNEDNWYAIAEQHLEDEVTEYDRWLQGDIYGYCLEKLIQCPHCLHEEEEFVDSCGGFYGNDLTTNGMLDCLPEEIVTELMEVLNA